MKAIRVVTEGDLISTDTSTHKVNLPCVEAQITADSIFINVFPNAIMTSQCIAKITISETSCVSIMKSAQQNSDFNVNKIAITKKALNTSVQHEIESCHLFLISLQRAWP